LESKENLIDKKVPNDQPCNHGDKRSIPIWDQVKEEPESKGEQHPQRKHGEEGRTKNTAMTEIAPLKTKSMIHESGEAAGSAENIASSIPTRRPSIPTSLPQLTPLQTLQSLQQSLPLPSEQGLSGGIDEQSLLQSVLLKKQMAEMNKQALEQKVQDYIQGKTSGISPPQPQQSSASPFSGLRGGDLSQHVNLQSMLSQESGAQQQSILGQQQLPLDNLARQAALQNLLATERGAANPISEALTHDVVHRRLVIESMLMSEENRLRQLREALQNPQRQQFNPTPHSQHQQLMNQVMGGGGIGGLGGLLGGGAIDPRHEILALERERAASIGGGTGADGLRSVMLAAEVGASAAERQMREETALTQALAPPAPPRGGMLEVSPERLLEAARSHGLDPQTMTPGQLAQLMGMVGRGL